MKLRLTPVKHVVLMISSIVMLGLFCSQVVAVARGYISDDKGLSPGMVVKLSNGGTAENPRVNRATYDQPDKVIGVVTTSGDSAVTIASNTKTVYVESSGELEAYVSDVNGEVKKGDLLTISPVNGVMGKHGKGAIGVYGLALENLADKTPEHYEIQTPNGSKTVNVAKIKINFDQKGGLGIAGVDSSLERLGQALVGKQVGEIRVAVALVIFVIVLIAEAAILYAAISSAIASIGRNPLAGEFIKRQLVKVVLIALVVLVFGLGSIYLVLWF
jgi:hypothetical protein